MKLPIYIPYKYIYIAIYLFLIWKIKVRKRMIN